MDTPTVSLLFGCLCAGLVWWVARGFARRRSGKPQEGGQHQEGGQANEAPWEQTDAVYARLLHLRIVSFVLCLLAGVILYFRVSTVLAVAVAGVGCLLQCTAFHLRTRHMQAVRKAAEAEFTGKTPSSEQGS